jgi:hypothetical protein
VAGVVESMSNQMFTSDYIDNTGTLFAVLGWRLTEWVHG